MTFRELFQHRVLTLSNLLSLSRIFLLIPLWHLLWTERSPHYYRNETLAIVALMIATDFLDGWLARRLGQETPLGQYLDPVADKIVIIGGLILLYLKRGYPAGILIFILLREIYGTFFGMFLLTKRNVLGKPSYWGKTGVFFISVSGICYLLDWEYSAYTNIPVIFTLTGGIIAYGMRYAKTIFSRE